MSKRTIQWDTVKERELLTVLPDYPILWDASHPEYMKKNLKNQKWRRVAEKIGLTSDSGLEVAQKFRNLRTVFLRNKSTVEASERSGCGTEDVYVPSWQHWKTCSFMMNSATSKESMSNLNEVEVAASVISNENNEVILDSVSPNSNAQEEDYGYEIPVDVNESNSPPMCFSPVPMQSLCPPPKKAKTSKGDLDKSREKEFYNKCLEVLSAPNNLIDPFMISLAEDMAQLPPKKRIELKKILQITVSDFVLNYLSENE